jgi:hypothetical protein
VGQRDTKWLVPLTVSGGYQGEEGNHTYQALQIPTIVAPFIFFADSLAGAWLRAILEIAARDAPQAGHAPTKLSDDFSFLTPSPTISYVALFDTHSVTPPNGDAEAESRALNA